MIEKSLNVDEYEEITLNKEVKVYVKRTDEGYIIDVAKVDDDFIGSVTVWNNDLE